MNKLGKIIGLIAFIVLAVFLCFDEYRNYYCLPDGKCLTVWKRVGGTCYIIPGKYYGVAKPSENYIKTTNTNDATIYWNKKTPDKIIVRIEESYSIVNTNNDEIYIEDFRSNAGANLDSVLYNKSSLKFSDVNTGVDYISVYIKENYARSKNGKLKK